MTTNQTKDDWEEINFVFNSSVLTDGYPSLLRLAELLGKSPDYTVELIGNTDYVGTDQYNEKLGRTRAETVRDFLVKNGARPNQIKVTTQGEARPRASNETDEGRFMNRRVTMIVRDGQGKVVSAAGVGPAIRAIEQAKATPDCCEDVLKLLRDQKAILDSLKDAQADNERLRKELEALREGQTGIQQRIEQLPKPPQRAELEQMMEATAQKALERAKPNRFALLGLNIGPTLNSVDRRGLGKGNITFTGKGRYFAPFGRTEMHALQVEGEYMFYKDRQEGQFDIGLVNRFRNFQLGLFSSMKHVNLTDLGGGTLGQATLTADGIFSRGRVGLFGSKGYLTDRLIARTQVFTIEGALMPSFINEHLLRLVDQIGVSAQVGAWNDAYLEGHLGALFRHGGPNRAGGAIKLVHPFREHWAFTVEAGLNETMLMANNTGRIAFSIQLGNWVRPKQFREMKHPVPVDVPRVRYELLTRRVRIGNSAPVADAGPDQIGVQAGTVTLDGTGSFDPDEDPITFQWTQIAGPSVALSAATASRTTFTATEGSTYSFRLTVHDSQGAQDSDTITVTTQAAPPVRIVRFIASPPAITAGQTTTLSWEIENADSAEISGIGPVNPRAGTSTEAPRDTTTYRLTARNRKGEVTESITVTVSRPQVRIINFQSTPTSITAGQSATLIWQTENADEASISGIGPVATSGTTTVSPAQTTAYTLTARNQFGEATANLTLTVTPRPAPTIAKLTATPSEILAGESSTVCWEVQNAEEVVISSGIGKVSPVGCQTVSPATTTTYTLTATNPTGEVTQTATVTVLAAVRITSFTANPTSVAPGGTVTLTWTTENATGASISGTGTVPVNGSVQVTPSATTTYTLTATGARATQATATVTVTISAAPPPQLTCDAGNGGATSVPTLSLSGTGSDRTGSPLSYFWRVLDNRPAEISSPADRSPAVTLGAGVFGIYVFELTVTNAAGMTCTDRVTIDYIDP